MGQRCEESSSHLGFLKESVPDSDVDLIFGSESVRVLNALIAGSALNGAWCGTNSGGGGDVRQAYGREKRRR
jgi:hypothetical protein